MIFFVSLLVAEVGSCCFFTLRSMGNNLEGDCIRCDDDNDDDTVWVKSYLISFHPSTIIRSTAVGGTVGKKP